MLEGLDSEWQFTKGSNNHLSYANLPVGEYVLRIKGTNSDKLWSSNEVQLKIKVLPPFFRSQLAYLDLCPRPVDCDYVNRMVLRKTHGETSERTYQEAER